MLTSINGVARLTGTTSRTLRHYDAVGLLAPSDVDGGGRRYYDQAALVRLQRILLLRRLGLGLPQIAEILDRGVSDVAALREHAEGLRRERQRIERQLAAVERTIAAVSEGRPLMAEDMLDGFDHTEYRDEVEQRWGEEAYARSSQWWQSLGKDGQRGFLADSQDLATAWRDAAAAGLPPSDPQVQALAARHIAWIGSAWGGTTPTAEQVRGLAQMYVDDERFAANYGGAEGAAYVRDALFAATA
jgi:DNA-binding transcriptional MerR regulator